MRPLTIMVAAVLTLSFVASAWTQPGPDRGIFGEFNLVPGEQFGSVRLGFSRDNIVQRYGQPLVAPGTWPHGWHWPENDFGQVDFWPLEALLIGKCRGSNKVFYVAATLVSEPVRYRALRMKTPEGLTIGSGYPTFSKIYGEPATFPNPGVPGTSYLLYNNGVTLKVNVEKRYTFSIGAHNVDICTMGQISGKYIPWIGRSHVKRIFMTRSGDPAQGKAGEPTTTFTKGDRVYVALEIAYPKLPADRQVEVSPKFTAPDGRVIEFGAPRIFRASEESKTIVFSLPGDSNRPSGQWNVEVSIAKTPIAEASFTVD